LAYTTNILLTRTLWNWGGHCSPWLRAWWQPYSDCRLQTSARIHDWAKFMRTPIGQFKLTNTIINNHRNSVYMVNVYTCVVFHP